MLDILKYTVMSLLIIISIHYIYIYLMDNLTMPITIDLISRPNAQYKELYETLNKNIDDIEDKQIVNKEENNNDMKSELLSYFKELSNKKDNVTGIDNYNNFTNY